MEWYYVVLIFLGVFLLIGFVLLFMIYPASSKKIIDYRWLFDRPIAHRGYHNNQKDCPENSKIAYEKAIKNNYHIEIDIHISKDNQVVVFHDDNVIRMCGINKKINEMTLKEIKDLNLQGGMQKILTLKEFLDLVDDKVGCLIEYKDSQNGRLERYAWEILKNYKGRYAIQTFQPKILKWFKKNQPNIPRGQLCFDYIKTDNKDRPWIIRFLFTHLLGNFIGRPHFISYDYIGVNYKCLKIIKKLKAPVLVWTIKNLSSYNMVKNKCDNIIFENLEL